MNINEEISLLRNDQKKISESLKDSFRTADEIHICVAFLKESGLKNYFKTLQAAAKRGCKMFFYIGTDFYQTEPSALVFLLNLRPNKFNNIKFYLMSQKPTTFHPKIYITFENDNATAFIGSSNMTQGGLSDNIEAMVKVNKSKKHKFICEILNFFNSITENERAQEANSKLINNYKLQYDTYKETIKKAEKNAKEEIAKLNSTSQKQYLQEEEKNKNAKLNSTPHLNKNAKEIIAEWLEKYLNKKKEQENWLARVDDYKNAEEALKNIIISKNIKDFSTEYEKLVGGKEINNLFHSAGLWRNKGLVTKHYTDFKNMLNEIRKNIGKEPEVVFNEKLFKKIKGLGYIVPTVILNTYMPEKYPILSSNPLETLKGLGFSFVDPRKFNSDKYAQYSSLMSEIASLMSEKAELYDFKGDLKRVDLGRVDHFMYYLSVKIKS